MTNIRLTGVILAGGESKRMGRDKSLLDYHGMPQREYLHQLLGKYCDVVLVSCKSSKGIPAALNPVEDVYNFKSPLSGILSAFSERPSIALLAVAVDMPFIDDNLVQFLIDHRAEDKPATCFFDSEGKRPEPMLCIWEQTSFKKLIDFVKGGNMSPRDFLEQHKAEVLRAPDSRKLANVNTQAQFSRLRP
jgi:molybdopterin-guanine dinucleotide biosynthesis protein A